MSKNWLEDLFADPIEDIRKVVRRACPQGWKEVDEVLGQVLWHLHRHYVQKPEYLQSRASVLAFVWRDTDNVLKHMFRGARRSRVEYRDPQRLPDPAYVTGEIQDAEWDRLRRLFADCERATALLSDVESKIREAFRMKCDGAEIKEIVRRLKEAGHAIASESSVHRWLKQAYEVLRKKLVAA
jgi:DNA-directed RNA polymerase specialized sigma24 family protein